MDPTHHLPLQILRSDPTPSAPNRSAIDWLPDFLNLSWIAYGSSSLLVISHFPSPLSQNETEIGPIFRQVFELSGDPSSAVRAVAWSPVTPSVGEVAAAAENCVWIFSHDSASSKGSFCWSQNAVLVHSAKVEAIGWTGSGDGVIVSGIEVVLWKRSGRSWEIAWKFNADQPQSLVSATWSVEGPFATAAYQSKWMVEGLLTKEASKCVLVCQRDGKSEFVKSELQHPLPVSMIQWRPLIGKPLSRDAKHPSRHLLLTCCLDGTVRLWCEVDDRRARKVAKDINDHRTVRWSFSVAAVIEINQAMHGVLGIDIYVTWAMETAGVYKASAGTKQLFSAEGYEHDQVGNCEWLVGFGPGMLVKFWAVHCLDDVSPVRFPRVTLWKSQELQVPVGRGVDRTGLSYYKDRIPLNKVSILRSCLSGPPVVCSLIQLLPCNSLVWSLLYTQTSNYVEDSPLNKSGTGNTLSCSASGRLNLDGHSGRILQVAVHPYSCEVELAVSLDSDGLVLFWFCSTISNYILGCPTLVPAWEICGKLETQSSCSRYTSVSWAPSVVNEVVVLLMGHAGGIDCFIVKIHQDEEELIECHYLCTIPYTGHGPYECGPNSISTIPLLPPCHNLLRCSKFMLLGAWMNEFQALSWEITLHTFDLSGNFCDCDFETGNGPASMWAFEGTFANIRYCLKVNACSSQLPDPHIHDEVTSFAVVCQSNLMPTDKTLVPTIDQCTCRPAYLMATGCSDGTLKLWTSIIDEISSPNLPWELVGMFVAHKGPISTVCLSDCGQKIATICKDLSSNTVCSLHIWDPIHLGGAGSFMLEDTLFFDQEPVALNWLPLGNGQLVLGVCTLNQLRVYSLERCGGQTLLNPEKSVKKNIWVCIASTPTFPPICDFFWGPRATAVFVHKSYFCVNSQWLFLVDKKHLANGHSNDMAATCMDSAGGIKGDTSCTIFFDCELQQFDKLLVNESGKDCKSGKPLKTDLDKDYSSSSLFVARSQLDSAPGTKLGLWTVLEVLEKLSGTLPVYHPEALFVNIYSGNWKRAYIALRHLNDFLSSDSSSGSKHYTSKSSSFVPQILLSTFLDGIISKDSNDKGFQWSGNAVTSSSQLQTDFDPFTYNWDSYGSNILSTSSSTKYGLVDFVENLEKLYELAAITNTERVQILAIFDLLNEMTNSNSSSVYESLDEPGQRFWMALRFQQLHFIRKFGRSVPVEELVVDSKLIGWAYHSDCQENLIGFFLSNEPSWQEMRNLGVGFWFTNTAQLRSRMEKLARLQYLKRKDPKDCALLYIALNRTQVLCGLFKISKDEKDKPLVAFLSRNFQEEKNKAAALKNAYVLMGRHQLELAVAFFLLGGDTSSAVGICAKNLGDEQLAVVICRLTEGRGGPLSRHLMSKSLLPFAIERGDSWLASLLEWELGNYCQSFVSMLGLQIESEISATLSNGVAFSDPNVGLYCLLLATKNSMKNAVGERNTAILSRWAVFMTATALKRCGLPLEALEYLSTPTAILGDTDQGTLPDIGDFKKLHGILNPSPKNSSNWISSNVAFHLEFRVRLDLSLQYLSTLVREHPSWLDTVVASSRAILHKNEFENHEHVKLLESFRQKLYTALLHLEQKFSVVPFHLISMVLLSLYDRGLWFVGYEILHAYTSQDQDLNKSQIVRFLLYPLMHKRLLKATRETSLLFSHVIAACGITCSELKSDCLENNMSGDVGSASSNTWDYYFQGLILSIQSVRSALQIISVSSTEDLIVKPLIIIDWIEYYVQFAYAWLQRNSKILFLLMQPLLLTFTNGHTPYEVDLTDLKKILPQIAEVVAQNSLIDNVCTSLQGSQGTDLAHLIPEDERWKIIGACLWQHISRLIKHKLGMLSYKLDEGCISGVPHGKHFSWVTCSENLGPDDNRIEELIGLVSLSLVKLLKTTLAHASSYHVKRLASHLQHKIDNGLQVMTLVWLEEYNKSQTRGLHQHLNQDMLKLETIGEKLGSDILWDTCADPKIVSEGFIQEKINLCHSLDHKPFKGWNNIYRGIKTVNETEETHSELTPKSTSSSSEPGLPSRSLFRSGHSFLSGWQKDTALTKEVSPFLNPKEIYKRNGELLEALCLNSVNQKQAALASNRKGILFFNWKDDMPDRDHSDYIWSEADWPLNGWAGSESTPAPTYVAPGVGLGIKKGAHLGLGGATVGGGSLARSPRDLTGGGGFGNLRYPGMRVSGLGWETREDFEEVVDPPPTVENANTRVFSSHPSRPFFLVGSSNTHIYLWEFGKDKATATYGVLPAVNVPPPYALASISSLQFDHCGHRFATAALDGTVCTWQLEVGGRSNIRPTESSLCFNSHASDVAYVTSSGSIIAVAGYSSSSVNVVIWDTLAPPTTSRASIMCHEGGARSISVFDNDIGSGSISPLIVTGGKGGDVGLHDFRYIATGRSKRHRHTDKGEQAVKASSNIDHHPGDGNKFGEQNQNGMLWYIPKAHSGSVTKISIIPNTSLFLTGSKDGDVKLWDAKRAKLVCHWPKLHERHTFLQPNSRGFGGVVQAAVTDIKVVSQGFLSCGGDGTVKLVYLKDQYLK